MARLLYLDQNAWVALAKGSWAKERFPQEHAALTKVVESVQTNAFIAPLTFANIYETSKINDSVRRTNIARVQCLLSAGRVFRSRRRILNETLTAYIAHKALIPRPHPVQNWFLSDLWFEAAGDYSPETYGFKISDRMVDYIRRDPGSALFKYLTSNDEQVRREAVRRFSGSSLELIARLEAQRALVAGETLAIRKRAYGARLIIDELDFIFATGKRFGLDWTSVRDVGPSLVRSMTVDVPILHVERELVVRLEDQSRAISENDLRDMMAFITVLPLADVVVGEKPFVNMARQARLDECYETKLITSIFDF